jgi:hypothetical protein
MLSHYYCAGAAAATCLALMIVATTIQNTSAQHLTVVPNTSVNLRPANMSTSLAILGEYHLEKGTVTEQDKVWATTLECIQGAQRLHVGTSGSHYLHHSQL